MNNFLTRSISALVYAAIFIFAILYSEQTYIGLITFFACVCIWEFSKIINSRVNIIYYTLIFGLVIASYFKLIHPNIILFLLIICLLNASYLILNLYSKSYLQLRGAQRLSLQCLYIVLSFFFLAYLPFKNNYYQPNLVIFIILLIWTNDSFAYLVGKNFGKHKLFERISPKKTIEGFVGGFIFSVLASLIIARFSTNFTLLNWITISIIVSVFGTLGDLIESKFKRQANVKDSGTIMPGHGGLLDRLDSLFFLAPFVYLYIHFFIS